MYAVRVHEYGGPEVLSYESVPDPVAGPGQVVVAVEVADVLFLDTLLRNGWGKDVFPLELPYIPGGGGAGTVLSVGEGVDASWIGRRVVARTSTGYAEQVVAEVGEIAAIPDGLGLCEAAAVMHDGATAARLVEDVGGIRPGEWVLIAAASGGAGSLLVQMARNAGAHVIAAARGEQKLQLARTRGAEVTVEYSTPSWVRQVREATGGLGADLTFDGAGGELGERAFDATADGGRFITYGSGGGLTDIDSGLAAQRHIEVHYPLAAGPPDQETARAGLRRALELAAAGMIHPAIGATYPLERAVDAHIALANRSTVGKSLLLA